MTTPFYVSPEQLMKDRADYARKGIARGRSVIVLSCADGVVFVAQNPSRALHKVSEIYDRIGFAAVGKYNEFENLRVAGVRLADLRGYSFDRRDVTGRWLANAYAQTLGAIFSGPGEKPYEVEIVVAEVGSTPHEDQLYRLTYDGSVADERGYVCMGGQAEAITTALESRYEQGSDLASTLRLAVEVLSEPADRDRQPSSGSNSLASTRGEDQMEVALLDRNRPRHTFRRLSGPTLQRLLDSEVAQGEGSAPGASSEQDQENSPPTDLAGGAPEPSGPQAEN